MCVCGDLVVGVGVSSVTPGERERNRTQRGREKGRTARQSRAIWVTIRIIKRTETPVACLPGQAAPQRRGKKAVSQAKAAAESWRPVAAVLDYRIIKQLVTLAIRTPPCQ